MKLIKYDFQYFFDGNKFKLIKFGKFKYMHLKWNCRFQTNGSRIARAKLFVCGICAFEWRSSYA